MLDLPSTRLICEENLDESSAEKSRRRLKKTWRRDFAKKERKKKIGVGHRREMGENSSNFLVTVARWPLLISRRSI